MGKLKKLNDFKSNELSNVQMSLFRGTEDRCTGGGFYTVWLDDGNGGKCSSHTVSWTSDVNVQINAYTWTTRYHGQQITLGNCW